MLIFDGDYPMSTGAFDFDRDLTLPIEQLRSAPPGTATINKEWDWPDAKAMCTLPEMRKAGIAIALVKVFWRINRPESTAWGYRGNELAYGAAQGSMAYYKVLASEGRSRVIMTREDLQDHMRLWSEAESYEALPVGMIIGMEGADPILWPEQLHEWWEQGLRVVSFAHAGISTYSHAYDSPEGGLLPEGLNLLTHMDSCGAVLDVSHMSDRSIEESLEVFNGPVEASHSACRALSPGNRQLPDHLVRSVVERNGVIGIPMSANMLFQPTKHNIDVSDGPAERSFDLYRDVFPEQGPERGKYRWPREAVTLEDVGDHIDHVCQIAGDASHVGIGGDTDGITQGNEGAPAEVDTVVDYQKVGGVLAERGYSDEDIELVMFGNWVRFYVGCLPSRRS